MLRVQDFVDAKLYKSTDEVVQDALRHLLRVRGDLRIQLAIHHYQVEEISLANARYFDRTRDSTAVRPYRFRRFNRRDVSIAKLLLGAYVILLPIQQSFLISPAQSEWSYYVNITSLSTY